jgi:HD-GYP domain-containing protein (c-di-GMP phosphodiesterase class II)
MGQIVNYNLKEEMEHGVYVCCLVRDLAAELGIKEPYAAELRKAGILHDIGKLRLTNYLYGSDEARSPLMIEEMKYVRMHPMLSYQILSEKGYGQLVLESVRYHHENYDGSGYPFNLKGEEIPLGARLIRICDVFAALTSDRPYRSRFTVKEAMSLMIDEVNHFDMEIFLAFQRVAHRYGSIHQVHYSITDEELLKGLPHEGRLA